MKLSADRRYLLLLVASRMGELECVRILLQHHVDPDTTREETEATPLTIAAMNGHVEVCRLLLDHGADPNHPAISPPILSKNFQGNAHKVTPDILTLLIDQGAIVNAEEADGETALFYAVRSGQLSLVQCLLEHGAEMNLWAMLGALCFIPWMQGAAYANGSLKMAPTLKLQVRKERQHCC